MLGPRQAAVARELTKHFESVRRGALDALAADYERDGPPKGEIVLLVAPPGEDAPALDGPALDDKIRAALAEILAQGRRQRRLRRNRTAAPQNLRARAGTFRRAQGRRATGK